MKDGGRGGGSNWSRFCVSLQEFSADPLVLEVWQEDKELPSQEQVRKLSFSFQRVKCRLHTSDYIAIANDNYTLGSSVNRE